MIEIDPPTKRTKESARAAEFATLVGEALQAFASDPAYAASILSDARFLKEIQPDLPVQAADWRRLWADRRNALKAAAASLRPEKKPTSKYRGVCGSWNSLRKPWRAAIGHEGRVLYLGSFATPEEAARAYDQAAVRLRGPHAKLNFPESSSDE